MAARAVEKEIQWSVDLWTLHSELDPAIELLNAEVERLKTVLEAEKVVMALSDYTDPWRKKVMPTYKANRKDVRKPVVYKPLREWVHEAFTTFQRPGLEGDDCLGILMTNPVVIPGDKIIVSLDKDMKTVPGYHYNMQKDERFDVTPDEADFNHLMQTLTGDTTDGYPGCKGVGPVSARKLLAPFVTECGESGEFWLEMNDRQGAWKAIVAAYTKAGLGEEEALRNARVARILRHGEYDYTKKEVKLWQP